MADSNQMVKDIVNNMYNGALVSVGTVAISKATKMITKKPQEQLDWKIWDMVMLSVDIGLSTSTVKWAQDKGYIPDKIMK